ncbi:sugar phosphate nucleotidyltransferase [Paenibacillus sp. 1011MAR3C5]|uniref:sugar phosphate nucleotidyltransferase n=1 Tax=Paenibacillus sp. 1011MAR3C5 TaxID=1675787 RepID=UPI0016009E32|nr:sugar phosphate nucleotidyltransferase [Paenibacillus sp. 1011MAR3C5]
MKIVMLSGGPGKRVWPLSDTSMPKQYLPVLDGPGGEPESMVQRLWRQLLAADLMESASVATSTKQAAWIKEQLGRHVPLLEEPAQRGSYSAALLAASYYYSVAGVSPHEIIVMLPVDMYVSGDFFHCIRSLPKLLRENEAPMMMVGTSAEYPGTRYGYILADQAELGEESSNYDWRVRSCCEKPGELEAEELFRSGALWNSGVYAFQLDFLLGRLTDAALPIDYEELYKQYFMLPKLSLEDGLACDASVDKSVIRYDGLWVNLNSWRTLSERIAMP